MTPATPNIQESGPYIISTSLVGNQWYDAVGMLVGETSYVLTPLASGDYYSIVTLDNCVSDTSNVVTFDVNATGIENTGNNKDIVLYPVPAVDNVLVKISGNANNETTIKIYNMVGVLVKTEYLSNAPINVSSLPSGIYVMSLQSTNFIANKALIIQR